MSIKVEFVGLETKEDREAFNKKCTEFWMDIISQKINELSLSYEMKVEVAKEIIEKIHEKEDERS